MGLEVYRQCMLIFLLGIRGVKLHDLMECGIGEIPKIHDAKVECYHAKELKEHPSITGNCKLIECSPNRPLTWRIIDENSGKIEVRLYGLIKGCDFDYYDIYLELYNAVEPVNEPNRCLAGSWLWKTHSKRTSTNLKCSYCSKDPSNCLQVHTLIFNYVFPGVYRIKITPKLNNGSTRQSQVSHYFVINDTISKYVKKRLVDLDFSIILQYRDSARQLDVGIPLSMDIPPAVVGFLVKYSPQYSDLYAITRYGSKDDNNVTCRSSGPMSKPDCYATKKHMHCTFFNMSRGFYEIVVEFLDDRCEMSTLWTESTHYDESCRWDIKKEYKAPPAPKEPIQKQNNTAIIYSAIALSVLLLLLIAFLLRKHFPIPRQRLVDQPDSGSVRTPFYSVNGSPPTSSNRFNFGQLLTLSERPRREVLLLYARESLAFTELVSRLKKVLDKICKCQVYDCFDMDVWNEVSEDPEGWIRTLIVERQAKVIIVASKIAALRQRSLMSEVPEVVYKTPHPFDNLFLYALKILRDGMDEESYKNHFVVTFDGLTESEPLIQYFNPYTRFILPKHLNKLFDHLQDSSTVHFDSSRRLEDRFESKEPDQSFIRTAMHVFLRLVRRELKEGTHAEASDFAFDDEDYPISALGRSYSTVRLFVLFAVLSLNVCEVCF